MTPSTPSLGHVYALHSKLEDFFAEGLEARYARHLQLANMTRAWAAKHGFNLFPEPGFESVTLTCVSNEVGGDLVGTARWQGTDVYGTVSAIADKAIENRYLYPRQAVAEFVQRNLRERRTLPAKAVL